MNVFPLCITPSVDNQDWGNAACFSNDTCEFIADRSLLSSPIGSPSELNRITCSIAIPHLVAIGSGDKTVVALVAKDVFIAHKQSISITDSRSILSSTVSAYISFYDSGHYKDNAANIFYSEREEVLSQLQAYNESRGLGSTEDESTGRQIPVFSTYSWSANIQHFIIEGMSQLVLFDELMMSSKDRTKEDLDYVYYLPDNSFAIELAEVLFGQARVRRRSGNYTDMHHMCIFLVPQQINFLPLTKTCKYALSILKRRIQSILPTESANDTQPENSFIDKPSLAFICRKPSMTNSTSRSIEDIEAVKIEFNRRGIDVIHPESLSVRQRIEELSVYQIVILEDGASIMNALFLNARKIVILAHPLFVNNRSFFVDFMTSLSGLVSEPDIIWWDNILEFEVSYNDLWNREDRLSLKYNLNHSRLMDLFDYLGSIDTFRLQEHPVST